jgi:hypothetical protein
MIVMLALLFIATYVLGYIIGQNSSDKEIRRLEMKVEHLRFLLESQNNMEEVNNEIKTH